jgi:tripartite-type tricarboxylate transporter receptor subunit TctC
VGSQPSLGGLYPKQLRPLKDFPPIGLAVTWSYTLVARKDRPRDLKELIAYARDNPEDHLRLGRQGSGQHIALAGG